MYQTLPSRLLTKSHTHTLYTANKKRFINLITFMRGGGIDIISVENAKFLERWAKMPNSGQNNCGIFVLEGAIIKCEKTGNTSKYIELLDKINDFRYFPKVHQIYKLTSNDGIYTANTEFIMMERLLCDVTEFIFDHVPYNTMAYYKEQLNIGNCDVYYDIYRGMIPHTNAPKKFVYNNEMYPAETIKTIEMLQDAKYESVKYDTYTTLMRHVENAIRYHMKNVSTQITLMRIMLLLYYNYKYTDKKLDNYGISLYRNCSTLGLRNMVWINNKLEPDLSYRVHILDWSSGLSEVDKKDKLEAFEDILGDYNNNYWEYSVYGQYSQRSIAEPVSNTGDLLGSKPNLSELSRILSTGYKFTPPPPEEEHDVLKLYTKITTTECVEPSSITTECIKPSSTITPPVNPAAPPTTS